MLTLHLKFALNYECQERSIPGNTFNIFVPNISLFSKLGLDPQFLIRRGDVWHLVMNDRKGLLM